MAKINAGDSLSLNVLSKAENKIGDFKYSSLSEAQFASEHLGQWMLCDGRSCVGTEYATLTGKTNVPDVVSDGAFVRQAKTGRAAGSKEGQDWKGFYMMNTGQNTTSYNHNEVYHGKSTTSYNGNTFVGRWATPSAALGTKWDDSEIRPVNVALNLYVKVGY